MSITELMTGFGSFFVVLGVTFLFITWLMAHVRDRDLHVIIFIHGISSGILACGIAMFAFAWLVKT